MKNENTEKNNIGLADYKNSSLDIERRIQDLILRMTPEEKAVQLDTYALSDMIDSEGSIRPEQVEEVFSNGSIGTSASPDCTVEARNAIQRYAVEKTRLGIPVLFTTEALHGVMQKGSTIFPQQIALASTWEPELAYKTGAAIAAEARSYGFHEAWGPVLDLGRDPRWGRVEEGYGEDTYLAKKLAAKIVKGMQGDDVSKPDKVISEPKHFSAYGVPLGGLNCAAAGIGTLEHYSTYLPVFEAAFVEGGALATMCSYSSVDGVPCSGDRRLLTDLLRGEWGMKGYVRSDMCAISMLRCDHDVAENEDEAIKIALEAGVDVQLFDFPHELYQGSIVKQLKDGRIKMETVDLAVSRVLRAKYLLGLFENPYTDISLHKQVVRSKEHIELALEVARKEICLLKNKASILPLDKSKLKRIAVVGPSAAHARLGDYCPAPFGFKAVSLLDGIKEAVATDTEVIYKEGCSILDENILPIPSDWLVTKDGESGLYGEYFNSSEPEGIPVFTNVDKSIDFNWIFSKPSEAVDAKCFSVKWCGKLVPKKSFLGSIGVSSMDSTRLTVNGKLLVDTWGKAEQLTELVDFEFEAGKEYDITLCYRNDARGARIILGYNTKSNDFEEAVEAARNADIAILAMGDSEETCGEGFDRADLNLPGKQLELVKAIHATGTPVVLVLQSGRPLSLTWEDEHIPAIIEAWFPGEMGGQAIAEVLFGTVNPSGRLPMSFPKSVGQIPVNYNRRPAGGKKYVEMDRKPLYPFGYGLSYTKFEYSGLAISKAEIKPDGEVTISFDVKNIGQREGVEVPQLYIRDCVASVVHPYMEIKGFTRLCLKPGETKTVSFTVGYDELKLLNLNYQWVVEPGRFIVMVGGNSEDLSLNGEFRVVV